MRGRALGFLLLLLTACGTGPYEGFDHGFEVHFILHAENALLRPRTFKMVCAVGDMRREGVARTMGPGHPSATEVAVILTPAGERLVVMWDKENQLGGRQEIEVSGPMWVVLPVEPGNRAAKMEVYQSPPHKHIGTWEPLVAVPN